VNDKLEFIKNPVIAELLGLLSNTDFAETNIPDWNVIAYMVVVGFVLLMVLLVKDKDSKLEKESENDGRKVKYRKYIVDNTINL
jgi:hypothetical protein